EGASRQPGIGFYPSAGLITHLIFDLVGRGAGGVNHAAETVSRSDAPQPPITHAAAAETLYVAPSAALATLMLLGRSDSANSRSRTARSAAYVGVPNASEIAFIDRPSFNNSGITLKKFVPPLP